MPVKAKIGNLVVLSYASNNCYVTLFNVKQYRKLDPDFKIDIIAGTWSNDIWSDVKIGNRRSSYYPKHTSHECREGIIGV